MSICLENVSKHFGTQVVVNNLNLEVQDGEFFVLLGASGSGKTTVLNLIAGLVEPDQGRVLLHGRDVTDLPTQKRNVGFVFQNYALFRYMTVAQNIEFGLQVRGFSREERRNRCDELLELVGLVGLGSRMPNQLSGGQQQRVALARALAVDPEVLLLDEPLGALDAKIRVELRRSLKRIQRKSGIAAILVTHDQEEAFDLGDRIGVMNFGRLIEIGTPQELYQTPKTEYVASFLGSANLLLGQVERGQVHLGKHGFPLPEEAASLSANSRAQILFRPEDVALAKTEDDLECLSLGKGMVVEKGFNGPNEHLRVELPPLEGVRPISPPVPYGTPGFYLDVSRAPEQSNNLPLDLGQSAWVGVRRLHVLSHPGMSFLLITDGSVRSQSAIILGGHLGRMAHAQVLLLGVGMDSNRLEVHLQEARKQLGSGMASLQVETSTAPLKEAVVHVSETRLFDLAILGWRSTAGIALPEAVFASGDHHLLLAAKPVTRLKKALICLESGEPGKDNVVFAGRLLRHVGAEVTLMTAVPESNDGLDSTSRIERFLSNGQRSLARFGISTQVRVREGEFLQAVQAELHEDNYDLIVLGAPLPELPGKSNLHGVVGSLLSAVDDLSILIIRSHQYKRLQSKLWSHS